MRLARFAASLAALCFLAAPATAEITAQPVPIDDFARVPSIQSVSLSAEGDLVVGPGPAVYLGSTGRAVFIREWARMWRKAMDYAAYGVKLTLTQILDAEVQALARDIESGEHAWAPFTIR